MGSGRSGQIGALGKHLGALQFCINTARCGGDGVLNTSSITPSHPFLNSTATTSLSTIFASPVSHFSHTETASSIMAAKFAVLVMVSLGLLFAGLVEANECWCTLEYNPVCCWSHKGESTTSNECMCRFQYGVVLHPGLYPHGYELVGLASRMEAQPLTNDKAGAPVVHAPTHPSRVRRRH